MERDADFTEAAEDALDAAGRAVEAKVLSIMAHRLATLTEETTLSQALSSTSADVRKMESAIERGASDIAAASDALMADEMDQTAQWAAPMYAAAGATMSGAVAGIIEDGAKDAREQIRALCDTSAVGLQSKDGFLPIREAYVASVTDAVTAMRAGKATGTEAVQKAVTEQLSHMCRTGVRVRYASGATRELHAAVRQSVMGTYAKAQTNARWQAGREFGADGVSITAHALCAPDHMPYQGRRYTLEEFRDINDNQLERQLVDGPNCRHRAFPILMDETKHAYTDADLEEMRRESERTVTVDGREMTRYEATQVQRRYEREIRAVRLEAGLLEREGLDATAQKARMRELQARYRAVSKDAELTTRRERTMVYLPD